MGLFLFSSLQLAVNMFNISCLWLDSNPGPVVSEAVNCATTTAVPTNISVWGALNVCGLIQRFVISAFGRKRRYCSSQCGCPPFGPFVQQSPNPGKEETSGGSRFGLHKEHNSVGPSSEFHRRLLGLKSFSATRWILIWKVLELNSKPRRLERQAV